MRREPLSLMEYAGRSLIISTRYERYDSDGVSRPRSDLFCHHVMIACAIGGVLLLKSCAAVVLRYRLSCRSADRRRAPLAPEAIGAVKLGVHAKGA